MVPGNEVPLFLLLASFVHVVCYTPVWVQPVWVLGDQFIIFSLPLFLPVTRAITRIPSADTFMA